MSVGGGAMSRIHMKVDEGSRITQEHEGQLRQILTSQLFQRATTVKRLLQHLLEKTLEGGEGLTHQDIVTVLFPGKTVDYVAQNIRRVRDGLRTYNETYGGDRFDIPEGQSYLYKDSGVAPPRMKAGGTSRRPWRA